MHDVIVAGCGAVGSAALYQAARRGARVLGLDKFQPPHSRGSSHGDTRITRLALGEGAHYVQFARRSHEIWRELEAATGRDLLSQVGGLIFGSASRRAVAHGSEDFLKTTIDVARRHGIDHEVLDAESLARRFPQFRWRGDESGYFEREAGFVRPESCIAAQIERAVALGAELRTDEPLLDWRETSGGVRVTTAAGTYEARSLVLTAGAWLPKLLPSIAEKTRVLRQVLYWFEPDGPHELFAPDRMPVHIRVPDEGCAMFYGFPAIDGPRGGAKIAGEQFDATTDPDHLEREVSEGEIAAMHASIAPHIRLSSRCVRTVACMYTVTPNFDFIIDRHPGQENVWLASACSGHGFKHSAAVGEALAMLALDGACSYDLEPFRLSS